jgi:hypothetical protein
MKKITICISGLSIIAVVWWQSSLLQSAKAENIKQPTIFNYVASSNYVVVATLDKKADYVSKNIEPLRLDISDQVAGLIYSFKVEKNLCSKESLFDKSAKASKQISDFQIFVKTGSLQIYELGKRYLIFLQEIPKSEKLTTIYKLEEDKNYYRVFEGEESLFPNEFGNIDPPPKKGIIKMDNLKDKDLIERIELLSEALGEKELKDKIKNLQKLTESKDTELAENAKYAIEILQAEKVKQKQPQN